MLGELSNRKAFRVHVGKAITELRNASHYTENPEHVKKLCEVGAILIDLPKFADCEAQTMSDQRDNLAHFARGELSPGVYAHVPDSTGEENQ